MRPHIGLRTGMTLIELMVGLAVAGMTVAAGYAAFATTIDRHEHLVRANADAARAAGVRRMLFRWLDGATPEVAESGNDPSAYRELRFLTRAATPMQSPLTEARLYISDGSDGLGQGLVAMLRPDVGDDSLHVTIDSTARDMSIEYLVKMDGVRQWITADAMTSQNPMAVRLRIVEGTPEMAAAYTPVIEAPLVAAR